jgi:hypothetical protein
LQSEVPQFNPAWLLPELDMGNKPAANTAAPGQATAPSEPATNPGAESSAEAAPEGTNDETIAPDPAVEPVAEVPQQNLQTLTNDEQNRTPAGTIALQTLLRYFTRNGTNEVLIPFDVGFTPPVPSRSGGSSATYISE